MTGCCFQDLNRRPSIDCYTTGKETSTSTETQFCRTERVFYRTVWRWLADKSTCWSRRILPLRQSVNTVVQQDDINIHITANGMNEMVTSNGQSVSITWNLPDGKSRIHHFGTCSNGCGASGNGMHAIGIHIVRQTRRTTDTWDNGYFVRRYSQFGQCLMKGIQKCMVAASRTPAWLTCLVICCCIFCFAHCLFLH